MTDEESRMVREMYNALMVKQPGQREPLIERMGTMSRDWQRMGWASRALFAALLGVGSLLAAWDKIVEWLRSGPV